MGYQTIGSLLENPQVVGTAIGLGAVALAGAGMVAYDTIKTAYQRRQLNRQLELERQGPESLEDFVQRNRKDLGKFGYYFKD
jgi:hypothetical protein